MAKVAQSVPKRRGDALSRVEVARLRLLRMTPSEIAEEMGAEAGTIGGILAEPEVVAMIEAAESEAFDDAKRVLRTVTRRAAQRIAKAIDDPDPRVALDAAKTALTKAGADAPAKSESKQDIAGGTVLAVSIETARELARRGRP